MKELEKLSKLIPHWTEHLGEHREEIVSWQNKCANDLPQDAVDAMAEAIKLISAVEISLQKAATSLDGYK